MPESMRILLHAAFILLLSAPASSADWVDPTRPDTYYAPVASAAPAYILSAIFRSGDRQIAVVNGRSLAVGDRLGRAKLVRIDADRITLELDGRSIVRKLKNGRPEK